MPRAVLSSLILSLFLLSNISICGAQAQAARKASGQTAASAVQQSTTLAESGRCAEAMPLLKQAIRQVSDKELKKRIGLDGIHCAMTHNMPYDSLEFLRVLSHDFP